MNRSSPLKRKKGLRKVSPAKAKEKRETNPMRAFYVAAKGTGLECHEIASGFGSREKAVYDPDTWLALTREQHREIQGEELEKQCARKFIVVKAALDFCCRRRLVWEKILYWLEQLKGE